MLSLPTLVRLWKIWAYLRQRQGQHQRQWGRGFLLPVPAVWGTRQSGGTHSLTQRHCGTANWAQPLCRPAGDGRSNSEASPSPWHSRESSRWERRGQGWEKMWLELGRGSGTGTVTWFQNFKEFPEAPPVWSVHTSPCQILDLLLSMEDLQHYLSPLYWLMETRKKPDQKYKATT